MKHVQQLRLSPHQTTHLLDESDGVDVNALSGSVGRTESSPKARERRLKDAEMLAQVTRRRSPGGGTGSQTRS